MPPAHHGQFGAVIGISDHWSRIVGKHARHWRQVADVPVDDAKQRGDGGLVTLAREVQLRARLLQGAAYLLRQFAVRLQI